VRLLYEAVLPFLQHPVNLGDMVIAVIGLFDHDGS